MPLAAWRCWRPARPDEAVRSFEQAIAVDPGHAGAHYAYARACVELGRGEQAARLLRRAADLAPEDVGYLSTLYAVLNGLGRPDEAMATAREAVARCERQLARHPDFTVAAFTGAGALAILGERERALDWAQRALAIEPDDHMTLYNVACVYAVLGCRKTRSTCSSGPCRVPRRTGRHWMRQDSDMATAARPSTLRRPVRAARHRILTPVGLPLPPPGR